MAGSDVDGDVQWMRLALEQAQAAAADGEVPVGAVVVRRGELVGVGRNGPIARHDPTAHAEIVALRAAAQQLGNYRLEDCELYVTLEPCAMCSGAILHARLARVVFGAADAKTGAAGSVVNLFERRELNHRTLVQGGVLADACAAPLRTFFKARRINAEPLREDALRTPASRFDDAGETAAVHRYVSDLPSLAGLRLHYVDVGDGDASQVWLCLHGVRDWSWRYVQRLAVLGEADRRIVAPDLIGFGRSDKLKKESSHSLTWHAQVLAELVDRLNLHRVTIMAPADMAPLVRLVLAARPQHIEAIALDADVQLPRCVLEAPFPDRGHAAGPRALARLLSSPAG